MKSHSSESVLRGHPDKLADAISDAILDAHLKEDPNACVGCETLVKSNTVILAGEITSKATINPDPIIRPDGKVICTIKDKKIDTLGVALQYDDSIPIETFKEEIKTYIHSFFGNSLSKDATIQIIGFLVGGPLADTGLTGRKIIADTYGPPGPHGGGAFSGKDPTKIDRTGAYAARYIAKNIVATTEAKRATVEISYVIGQKDPINLQITTDTNNDYVPYAKENFPLTPADIIDTFDLQRPIYQDLAENGHFGRDLPWERIL